MVNLLGGGLVKVVGEGLAGAGVDTLDDDAAQGAALATDVVVTENLSHWGSPLKCAHAAGREHPIDRGDTVDQRRAELGLADFEAIPRLCANAVGERQGRRNWLYLK